MSLFYICLTFIIKISYNKVYHKYTVSCRLMSGVILLKTCIAAMPSYTYVLKGEKLLKARGYPCEIRRNETISKNGCGYSLYIYNDCKKAVEILEKYSVPYTISEYGGV